VGPETEGFNAGLFELPPVPPEGAFDARFASQRYVETHTAEARGTRFPIQIRTESSAPISVTASMNASVPGAYSLEFSDGSDRRSLELANGRSVNVPAGAPLVLILKESESVPTEYAVSQNYPNPFNPTSSIGFELPKEGIVSILVFDLLGREVARVIDRRSYGPGRHSATIEGGAIATGVYFYRLDVIDPATGTIRFQSTKKMILLR
jgi:hypothetical protein